MEFFTVRYSRPRGYSDPYWYGDEDFEQIVSARDGSRVVDLVDCPCGLRHPLGIQDPSGRIIYCADQIRAARPEDWDRPGLGEWS